MSFRDDQPTRPKQPVPAPAVRAGASEIPPVLGSYDAAGKFKFSSERDRINWLRKGYRQATNPEAFDKGTPLHPDVEAAYASGAVEAPHHVFQGPDGKFRGKNAATQELPEVRQARMQAWDGVRFKDVDPHAEKHIGEDEALKVMNGDSQVEPHAQMIVFNGAPFLRGAPNSGITLAAASDGKGGGIGGAVAAAGAGPKPNLPLTANPPLPRRAAPQEARPQGWQPPIPGSGTPPASLGIRSKPPYERTPQDLSEAPMSTGWPTSAQNTPGIDLPSQMPGDRGAAEQDWTEAAKWEGWPLNTLPRANHQRTPESIVAGILDNEMQHAQEDEWAKLEKTKPREIAQDKEDLARMIGAQAASEYHALNHNEITEEEFDSFVEAARRKLKLPVTNWRGEKEDAERSAALDEAIRNGEVEVYDHALDVTDVADMLVNGILPITDGRPGNEQTQEHVRILAEKIAAELTRCGATVDTVFGNDERQVQSSQGGNLGSHWPDISVFFEVNGQQFTLDVNHASTYAKTGELKPNEAKQIKGLYLNRWAQLQKEDSKEREGRVHAFPKKRQQMTEAEYFAKDGCEFVKEIIDCKSPVKIKVVLQKRKTGDKPPIPANER